MRNPLLKAMFISIFLIAVAFAWGQSIFYEEPFDTNQGWTLESNWEITSGYLRLGWSPSVTNYDLSATSPDIIVPATAGDMVVSHYLNQYSGLGSPPETFEIIAVAGGTDNILWSYDTNADWGSSGGQDLTLSLAPYAGQTIQLKFRSHGESTFNFNYWYIYDIKAYASLNDDLAATEINGPTTPNIGTTVPYVVTVRNAGLTTTSNYTVKLMQTGDVELGSLAGTSIAPQEYIDFAFDWTPTVLGETELWGKVVFAADENPNNNETEHLSVSVMESGLLVAEIGTGTATNTNTGSPTPYGTWYKAFRQQFLYRADDFFAAGAAPGMISAIAFNVQSLDTCTPMNNYRIRLKHTDQTALTTTFETGEYTTVWQRPSFMPALDWNVHNFDTPFMWDGASNLIVEIVTDMVTGPYERNALVYYSTTGYNSSVRYQSDSNHGLTGTTGTTSTNRSNTRFFMMVEGMGSLSGTVTTGGSPLPGAEISVENTLFTALSSADGSYSIPFVPEGVQTVSATKHGYNVVSHNVTIVEDEANIQDFALTLLPQVSVTGRIVGSDAPTLGIEGATIAFSGYEPYEATTDASGQFTIPNVFANQTYDYIVTADGYAQLPGQQEVGTTPVDMGDVMVNEVAYPVSGVVATEADDGNSVTVTWNEPSAGEEAWLHYDSGDSTTSIGTNAAADFDVAIRFPGNALLDHVGTSLQALKVWPAQPGDFSIRVWTGGTPAAPANMVVDQPFTAIPAQWNTVMLDTPVAITGAEELWFGYRCVVTGGHPAGCSPGPIVDGFSNMMYFQGEWATLIELNADLDYNWSIRGYAGFGAPTRGQELRPIVPPARGITQGSLTASRIKSTYHYTADTDPDRALLGYKVYRLLDDDQANEANWITLTTTTITLTEYMDNTWGTLPFGVYRYAAKAVYTGDVMSSPAFSNIVRIQPNDMSALTISGSITPSEGTLTDYTIRVKNTGTSAQAAGAYTVKIMSDDTELASVSGPAIDVDEEIDVTVQWTPTELGPIEIYGKVVLPDDLVPDNDETDSITVTVMAAGLLVVGIGDGTATNTNTGSPTPYGTWYRAFRQQFLIKAPEIYTAGGIPGMISGLSFNVQSLDTCTPMTNYRIRLKQTDQEALTATFETGEYTTVWQRDTFMPDLDWNMHAFDEPFFWNGTSNLIVEIVTDMVTGPYERNALVYYSTTDFVSSVRYQSDSANGSTGTTGTTSNNRSNIRLFIVPAGGDPYFIVSPASYDFGDTNLGGSRNKDFTIINAGGGTLNINEISISGSGSMTLSDLPTLPAPLETADTAVFTVTYAPYSLGNDTATVTIVDDQDNRHVIGGRNASRRAGDRDTHTIELTGSGVNDITIGNGNQNARLPMDFYWNNSVFQTIYSIDEMSNFVGMITGVKFYNNFNSNLTAKPTKIWLGSTTQTNLTDGWISSNDLTLVFDGFVDYPSGQNTISITFPEEYMHLDGGNLVMLVNRPMDTGWHSSSDYFLCQSQGTNRSRNEYSDSTEYDPAAMTGGTLSAQFPKTTFMVIPGGVGHITGTVLGAGDNPLGGVAVHVGLRDHTTTTDSNGQFTISNVLPNDYAVTFSRHGYITQTVDISLEEDETKVMNVTMNLMPQVSVTGTITASDTGAGLAGAVIQLTGYEDYTQSTDGDGDFSFDAVYADQSYEYIISCPGYTSTNGIINVGSLDYDMETIVLDEIAYAPTGVTAEMNDSFSAVEISWDAPDPTALEILESFEDTAFPPQDWSQIVTNAGAPNALGVYPTWCRIGAVEIAGGNNATPTDGNYQAGLWWSYDHQDEWLITPSFNCPPDAYMRFDSYVFLGSVNDDHYYVKASTDGGNTWTVVWDASTLTGGQTTYDEPFVVDLAVYGGQQMILAFNAEDPPSNDGLWYTWFIDNIYIGNALTRVTFDAPVPQMQSISRSSGQPAAEALRRDGLPTLSGLKQDSGKSIDRIQRVLVGYEVYRLMAGQETNESNWVQVTDEVITNLNHVDEDWDTLPNATYRWGVKAIYTAGVSSPAALSNPLVKESVSGTIVGVVRRPNGQGIAAATVTTGSYQATTNSSGAYSLILPVGTYSVTAAAAGYDSLTVDDVLVSPNQYTTVNFNLDPSSSEDDVAPVTATALKGNYPNPFNPQTTIHYDILEPCNVRLDIYNIKGQKVRTLIDETRESGHHSILFDSRDDRGNPLGSGLYLYRFTAGKYSATRKMMLME